MSILIENVTKHFGKNIVLDGIDLEIKTGSLVALLGGSGSGKSTLLRVVAGFEEPTTGRVWLNGKDSNSLSIQEKEIGFVFQAYALFQHLTVYENIAFGLSCNSSFFEVGLSNNPLINYFSQCSTFMLTLLRSYQHTVKSFIQNNKHNPVSSSFTLLSKHARRGGRFSLAYLRGAKVNQANKSLHKASGSSTTLTPPLQSLPWALVNLKTKVKTKGVAPNNFIVRKNQSNLFSGKDPFLKKFVNKSSNLDTAFHFKISSNKATTSPVKKKKELAVKPPSSTRHMNHINSSSNGNLRSVEELLRLVGLEELAHRYPNQLSGGQCQRVALARALAVQPKVLLLDEPFGALDTKVRKNLRRWLRQLHERVGVTTLFVTHDHQEAMEVANEIVVLEKGRVKHSLNSPQKIFSRLTNLS